MSASTAYVLAALVGIAVTLGGAAWRFAARVTRWADEVRDNTAATRKLARRHGKLSGRVDGLEKRVETLERR